MAAKLALLTALVISGAMASTARASVDRDTNCLGYSASESQQYCRDSSGNSVLCAMEGGSPIPSKEPKVIAWRNGYFTGRAESEGRTGVLGPTYWPQLELYCIENPSSNYYQAMRYMYENHYLDMEKPR